CAGCGRDIKNGQALLALDRQWHLGCFKCKACGKVLSGEYISKDGAPYCERDYQIHFGVQCEACHQFITGKVLEAGDKHYHPSCARCSRCNQMFTEGEEMYLQGSTVWHPDCKSNTRVEEKYKGGGGGGGGGGGSVAEGPPPSPPLCCLFKFVMELLGLSLGAKRKHLERKPSPFDIFFPLSQCHSQCKKVVDSSGSQWSQGKLQLGLLLSINASNLRG
ncbi:actin-binding LIM protein 1-like, partial [Hoplias malabaricus]|uniref:actin-binding LIM protein 1-like n=1 Tax=Hoplias malabaricus TaxID=27720 RepID=UPI0034619ADF